MTTPRTPARGYRPAHGDVTGSRHRLRGRGGNEKATHPYRGTPITGSVELLDVESGTGAGTVDILSLTGGDSRSIDVDGRLAGAAAWSPDGAAVATIGPVALAAGLTAMAAVALVRRRSRRRTAPAPTTAGLDSASV